MIPPTSAVYHSNSQSTFSAGYQFPLGNDRVLYVAGQTDIGTSRISNEDNLLLCGPLLVVADGIGSYGRDYNTSQAATWIACASMKMYGMRHDQRQVASCKAELEQYIQTRFGDDARENVTNAITNMTKGILDGSYDIVRVCTENRGSIESILYIIGATLSQSSPQQIKLGTTIAVADFSANGVDHYHQGDSGIAYHAAAASPLLLTPPDYGIFLDPTIGRERKHLTACLGRGLLAKRSVLHHDKGIGSFYLLQTDGLDPLGYARAFEIAERRIRWTSKKNRLRAVTRAMEQIILECLALDGSDNITGVLAYVGDE